MTALAHGRAIPMLLALTVVVSACAAGSRRAELAQRRGAEVRTIAVVPFNVVSGLPTELDESVETVSDALIRYLEAHGKRVELLEFRVGQALWLRSIREVKAGGGERSFESGARVFATRIAERGDYDAILVPSLYVQLARVAATHARWDGARQRVEFDGPAGRLSGTVDELQAASVFVHVLGPDGETYHSKRSGLELLQHVVFEKDESLGSFGVRRTVRIEPDDPALESQGLVTQGLARALDPFLPYTTLPDSDNRSSDGAVEGVANSGDVSP